MGDLRYRICKVIGWPIWIVGLFFFIVGETSCGSSHRQEDTATYGTISIASDDAFKPLVDAELDVFQSLYKYAKIQCIYKPEEEAFRLLFADSIRLIIASRELNEDEKNYFKSKNLIPRTVKIALEGVALIVHNTVVDTLWSYSRIENLFQGKQTTWDNKGKLPVKIVFDGNNSSNLRYMMEKFGLSKPLPATYYSLSSNEEVIAFVKKDPGAIGVIGASWISDGDDPKVKTFRKDVRVLQLSSKINPGAQDYYPPLQAYILTEDYPLSRSLYTISREPRTGLGTGFVSFLASDGGQKIVLKQGLVPAISPIRLLKIKNEPLTE